MAEVLGALIGGRPGRSIDVLDRGLHYGDGLFETLAVRDGCPQLWEAHLRRLSAGCQRLALPPPDEAVLAAEANKLCAGHRRAVLKLILTRGRGARGYRFGPTPRPTRVLLLYRPPDHDAERWRSGVAVRCCTTPASANPVLAGIKHLNRLEQTLARAEWDDEAIAEGLMFDLRGGLVSGTSSNVFLVRDGRVLTPALSACGVAGVMRGEILARARGAGLDCAEVPLGREDLFSADEVFLSNSLFGVWPVNSIDGTALPTGAVARAMIEALAPSTLAPVAGGHG